MLMIIIIIIIPHTPPPRACCGVPLGQLCMLEDRFKEATERIVSAEQRVKTEIVNGSKFADENDLLRKR
jgi:hypothetical protein